MARAWLGMAVLFASHALAGETVTIEQARLWGVAVTAGWSHACALGEGEVTCWGEGERNGKRATRVPKLRQPIALSAGFDHTCALDEEGVKCWGGNDYHQIDVPPLSHPRAIAVGGQYSCALDDAGVKCWGESYFDQISAPPLSHPRRLFAGWHHTCALDDYGLECWGGYLKLPERFSVKGDLPQISVGDNRICFLVGGKIRCWVAQMGWKDPEIAGLRTPTHISASDYVLAADGARVRRSKGGLIYGAEEPEARHPLQVAAGVEIYCMVDAGTVRCWDKNGHEMEDIPKMERSWGADSIDFALPQLSTALDRLAFHSYPYRAKFFRETAAALSALSSEHHQPRLFALHALAPVLESADSAYFSTVVLRDYRNSRRPYDDKFGVRSLSGIELGDEVLGMGLSLVQSALRSSRQYLTEQVYRRELDNLVVVTGRLQAEAGSGSFRDRARRFVDELGKHRKLFSHMTEEKRLQGFGMMIQSIEEYLKQGVER